MTKSCASCGAGARHWQEYCHNCCLTKPGYTKYLEDEIERLRKALEPFALVASGIPDNWPGCCPLSFVYEPQAEDSGNWHLGYAGSLDACPYPTIDEWRATRREAAEAEGKE